MICYHFLRIDYFFTTICYISSTNFLPLFCYDSSTKKVTIFPLNGNKSSTILQYFTTNHPLNGNNISTKWQQILHYYFLQLTEMCLPSYRIPESVRHGRQRAPKPNIAQHRVILFAID